LTIKIPQFLLNPWNSGRIVSYGFVVISAFSEACIFNPQIPQEFSRRKLGCRPWAANDNPEIPEGQPIPVIEVIDWRTAIAAISTFLLWIQFIQLLILSRPLAAFTYTLSAMFVDVTRNLAIILVILVSFAFTLTTLEQPGYESPGTAVLNLLYVILGMSSAEMESLEGIGLFCLTREFRISRNRTFTLSTLGFHFWLHLVLLSLHVFIFFFSSSSLYLTVQTVTQPLSSPSLTPDTTCPHSL
jgi:hypothetical protein